MYILKMDASRGWIADNSDASVGAVVVVVRRQPPPSPPPGMSRLFLLWGGGGGGGREGHSDQGSMRSSHKDKGFVSDRELFFVYFISGLEWPFLCLCRTFFIFERCLIRTQRAAVASRRATNLATHLPDQCSHPSLYLATHLPQQQHRNTNSNFFYFFFRS